MAKIRYSDDFKLIAPGSQFPIVILRRFNLTQEWVVYFEYESGKLSTYEGLAKTPEEAMERFIKYRINGEEYPWTTESPLYDNDRIPTGIVNVTDLDLVIDG